MTKEMMNIDSKGGIYFDCRDHAENKDVCIMCSTLSNLLIVACMDYGIEPKDDVDGHLSFDIVDAPVELVKLFRWVQTVFDAMQTQFPDYLTVY